MMNKKEECGSDCLKIKQLHEFIISYTNIVNKMISSGVKCEKGYYKKLADFLANKIDEQLKK